MNQKSSLREVPQFVSRVLTGNTKAEMQSHLLVFYDFLSLLWPPIADFPKPKVQAVTGLAMNAMVAQRKADWASTLSDIIALSGSKRNAGFSRYLVQWLEGHFITAKDLSWRETATARSNAKSRQKPGK
jgi:hypothetical protein